MTPEERSGGRGVDDDERQEGHGSKLIRRAKLFSVPLTTLLVAFIGFIGQQTLKEREAQLTERTLIEQKSRLFVELMSRREEAESSLRSEMFRAILGEFFEQPEAGSEVRAMSKRLLKLEMLALNFGESLSLSPLFRELERDLNRYVPKEGERDWFVTKLFYRERLQDLAKRVAAWQMAALEQPGAAFSFIVQVEEAEDVVTMDCRIELNRIGWLVRITLQEPRPDEQTVQALVHMRRRPVESAQPASESSAEPASESDVEPCTPSPAPALGPQSADFGFELSWFDFPMIDNTRLDQDQRFALTLTKLDRTEVGVSGAVFPGLYGSQRNKPFLDIVLEQLPELLYEGKVAGD